MIDQLDANHVEILSDSTGKLWINIDQKCALRIGKVATLQLNIGSDQFISRRKDGMFIARHHTAEGTCWCGKKHSPTFVQFKANHPTP